MVSKTSFDKLKKIAPRKRVKMAQQPEGASLLAALTPTQYAELFPKNYQRLLPDVGGFRAAMSQKTQEQQKSFTQKMEERIADMEKTVSGYGKAAKSRVGAVIDSITGKTKQMPQLPPEADAAFKKIQSGAISINSDEGRIFSKLSDKELSAVGITKGKDNTGRDVYQYAQPEVSVEEAKARLRTSGGDGSSISQRLAFYREYAKSKGVDPDLVTGVVMREGGQTKNRWTQWSNADPGKDGVGTAYGDFQLNVGSSRNPRMGNDYLKTGQPIDAAHWKEQGKFAIDQMANGRLHEWMSVKNNGGVSAITRIGANEWQSKVSSGIGTGMAVKPEGPNGAYSDQQITKMMDDLKNEKNTARKQVLANELSDAMEKSGYTPGNATGKWSDVKPLYGSSQSMCGRGVLHLSQQLFGDNKVLQGAKGLGSNANGVANGSNDIFQRSGMYHPGVAIDERKLTKEYLNSLPNGTIVASEGGDAQGNGHIQMKVNGRWISDFEQKNGFLYSHPGRQYSGFRVFNLTDAGQQQLVKNGFNAPTTQDPEKVIKEVTTADAAPIQNAPAPPPPPAGESVKKEETPVNPNPTPQQVKKEEQGQTASVNKPAAQPLKYKFDEAAFIKEVRAKETGAMFVSDEYIMGETIKGFKDTPGVKYDRKTGTLTIQDPNSPAIQTIINDMKSHGFDQNKFLSKQAALEAKQQTATVGEKLQREFGVASAQAGELDMSDPNVRAAIKAQHERGMKSNLIDFQSQKTVNALGISHDQYTAFRRAVGGIESGGGDWKNIKYNIRGGSSNRFAGAYQMGGDEIKQAAKLLGETAPVMRRGRGGRLVGNDTFLNDPQMQERYFDALINSHHESLLRRNKKYASLSPEDQMKALAYAHNQGAGGASKWLNTGKSEKDAFGTDASKYSKALDQHLADMRSQQTTQVAAVEQPKSFTEKVQSAASQVVGTPTSAAAETKPAPTISKPPEGPEFPKSKPTETPTPPSRPPELKPQPGAPTGEASTKSFLQSQGVGVPSKADGGEVNVKGQISAYPINGLRGDNTLAVDTKTQQPLFTFNPQTEAVMPNGQGNRADVVPTNKVAQGPLTPNQHNPVMSQLEALRTEMGNAFANIGQQQPSAPQQQQKAPTPNNPDPNFINKLLHQGQTPYDNPTFHRAMMRTSAQKETDDLHGHWGSGTQGM